MYHVKVSKMLLVVYSRKDQRPIVDPVSEIRCSGDGEGNQVLDTVSEETEKDFKDFKWVNCII